MKLAMCVIGFLLLLAGLAGAPHLLVLGIILMWLSGASLDGSSRY